MDVINIRYNVINSENYVWGGSSKVKKSIVFMTMILCLLLPKTIFANTTGAGVSKASPIQFQRDEYVRITQPVKERISVFDKSLNITGEARYNVKIKMQLFNKRESDRLYPRNAYRSYDLDPIGFSQTFNELVELREGDNKIRLVYEYTDGKGVRTDGRIVIYVTRKTEADRVALRNLRIDSTEQFTGGRK